jgi:hypothetical protein
MRHFEPDERSSENWRQADLVEAERAADARGQHSQPRVFQNLGVVKDFIDVDLPT